jgi:HEAT repeat protein
VPTPAGTGSWWRASGALVGVLALAGTVPSAQPPAPKPGAAAPPATAPASAARPPAAAQTLAGAIEHLGRLEYETRVAASRTVRRTPPDQAVPALSKAVSEHKDGYVRYRALVLLAGFNDPRTRELMIAAMEDPNDRLRDVAYAWLERHPEPALADNLLAKLEKELSEFVRPSLIRALAGLDDLPAVQQALVREANRGQDFFRSGVIETLGEHKAAYALPALLAIAKQDGPLQDDAVVALGQIGDKRALEAIVPLQKTAPRDRQPALATAICLLGTNCDSHERFLVETLRFTTTHMGFQDLARSASRGLAQLAVHGRPSAWDALVDIGVPSVDPVRAPIALSLATAAIGRPGLVPSALDRAPDAKAALLLLRDGFDMLAEDFDEERFYSELRREYWKAPEGSPARARIERIIATLDF